jgi:hypothetical protein
MGIGAIKTSFGGIGPMCQKGTDTVGEPSSRTSSGCSIIDYPV